MIEEEYITEAQSARLTTSGRLVASTEGIVFAGIGRYSSVVGVRACLFKRF